MKVLITVFVVLAVMLCVSARVVPSDSTEYKQVSDDYQNGEKRDSYIRCYFGHQNVRGRKQSSPLIDEEADADCQAQTGYKRIDWLSKKKEPTLEQARGSSGSPTIQEMKRWNFEDCFTYKLTLGGMTFEDYDTCGALFGHTVKWVLVSTRPNESNN